MRGGFEELPRDSCSINNSHCVIHDLRLIRGEGDEEDEVGEESEVEGHRELWMTR